MTLTGTPAKIASSMAGRPSAGARNFDQEIGLSRSGMQLLGRGEGAGRVVRQQGRHFQRNPAIHAICPLVSRSKQLRGPSEIFDRQLEEQFLLRSGIL